VATWTADKAKIVSVAGATILGLLSWTAAQLWASFEARGETLIQLERRQTLIESKAVDDRALLKECRDDVKEVRGDVKEILRRVGDNRISGPGK
jgi:hypothetical protein